MRRERPNYRVRHRESLLRKASKCQRVGVSKLIHDAMLPYFVVLVREVGHVSTKTRSRIDDVNVSTHAPNRPTNAAAGFHLHGQKLSVLRGSLWRRVAPRRLIYVRRIRMPGPNEHAVGHMVLKHTAHRLNSRHSDNCALRPTCRIKLGICDGGIEPNQFGPTREFHIPVFVDLLLDVFNNRPR